jgi:drug/metabolite transporter (DMT)-like permease
MQSFIQKYKYHLLLHLTVFLWGFTGVLGKLITLNSVSITAFRTSIAFISLLLYLLLTKKRLETNVKKVLNYLGVGVLIGFHWYAFFESIDVSNVSVALTCIASASFFISIIQPFFNKSDFKLYELLLGVLVIVGISLIFSFETQYVWGIVLGLITAFLGALFTVINGQFIAKGEDSVQITIYEMLGAFLCVVLCSFFREGHEWTLNIGMNNWVYLFVLGTICTAFAFMLGIYVMKEISPYTVTISVNLEPIYAIIMALIIFGDDEKMSFEFYVGGSVILLSILLNAYLKKHYKNKALKKVD